MKVLFQPKPAISDEEFVHAFRWLQREAVLTASAGAVIGAGSGILTAYALALGATNVDIGLLAAIPFLFAMFQLPAVFLVERYQRRKLIAVTSWFASRLLWFPVALLPLWLFVPSGQAVNVLIGLIAGSYLIIAITNTAWSSWMKDLVPSRILGAYFASRFSVATLAAAISGLLFSFFADRWSSLAPGQPRINGYMIVFGVAAVVSVLDIMSTLPVPEPAMARPASTPLSVIVRNIAEPYGKRGYRSLALFLFFWGLSSNLATPFFAVYMLTGLKFSLTTVMLLIILSQLVMVVFMRAWGPVADRLGSKAVLSIAVPLYMAVILGWVFTGIQGRYFLTIPLLVVLHVLAGVAMAGVNLCATTIVMKQAPAEKSTSYLVSFSTAANMGAGLAPVFGGALADFFSSRELSFALTWRGPGGSLAVPAFNLAGFDFVFIIAFLVGLLAVNALAYVVEQGEVRRDVILDQMMGQAQEVVRGITTLPGLRLVAYYPYAFLKHVPGISSVISLTGRQLTDLMRESVSSAVRGVDLASGIIRGVTHALGMVTTERSLVGRDAQMLAIQSVRGAVLAAVDRHADVSRVIRTAVASTLVALAKTVTNPEVLFMAGGYGAFQGANESGIDVVLATEGAIAGAQDFALLSGLDEGAAADRTVRGALEAARQLAPDKVELLQKSVVSLPEPREGG